MSYLVSTSRGLQIVMLNHVSQFVHTLFFNFSACIFLIKYLYLLMFIVKNKFKAHKHTHIQPINLIPQDSISRLTFTSIFILIGSYFCFEKEYFTVNIKAQTMHYTMNHTLYHVYLARYFYLKLTLKFKPKKVSNCCIKD